jgi:2',3'-cyclic-nucleotide 2'-phosphodiesterase (5'-nucleotidase family)
LARRATAIKQTRENAQGAVLILDAGGTLVGQWLSLKTNGQVMVEAMNMMGYDALTVGQMDLAMGLDALKQRETEAKFTLLSANLVGISDQKPLFTPYTTLERGGARIGIIGLTEPKATEAPGVADKATVLDPVETALKYVAELRPKVDVLIILSHLGLDQDQALAQAVPGIDVIIGGLTRQSMPEPIQVGNTLIVQQGYRGEWIGVLTAQFDAQGQATNFAEKSLALTPDYTDDADMAALVQKWAALYPSPTPPPTPVPAPTETPAQ